MKPIQITAIAVLTVFYIAYFTKIISQRCKGVKTDHIGKGDKPQKLLVIEILMKVATYSVVAVEVISIVCNFRMWKSSYSWIGIAIAALGVLVFIVAMATMGDSWRAGIPEKDKTELVTTGIYRMSRNPAFLGFDLMYLGVLIAFFNYLHLFFVLYAALMLHLQILQEEKYLTETLGEKYTEYKKHTGRYFIFDRTSSMKKTIIGMVPTALCIALAVGGFAIHGGQQMSKLPELTFSEALAYTTRNNPDAVITVGVIKDGQTSYKVYGENGEELPTEPHTYEIGSLTKTFTAALISKAATEGKLDLDGTMDKYLPLPDGNEYPTIKELLTHTSGYESYYFESPMIFNFLVGRNDFYGITKESVLNKVSTLNMDKESYGFHYSNFGYAVLGLVLEAVYDTDYPVLVNDFVQNELGLKSTKISEKDGDLGDYWEWKYDDAYLAAGGITSNITDMLAYAQMQLDNNPYVAECHKRAKQINATPASYASMGVRMDDIGLSWIIDNENGIVWHNGATGDYNSYLGFDIEAGTAVVVLSNLSPSYRIPATILGAKLLHELDR